jgi:aminopeptidase N
MSRPFALPGTRPRFAPDRPIDVEHYRLAVTLDPAAQRIAGTATLTVAVVAPTVAELAIDAVELEIDAVRVDGAPARFRHDGKQLWIAATAAVGTRLAVAIDYRGQPRRGLYFTAPDAGYPDKPAMAWTQGQDEDSRHWFPCIDAPHDKATSEVIATVPAAWTALSNGVLVADSVRGATRTLHWRLDVPHACYLVTLVAGDLATIETRWRDVPVSYHVVRGREAEAARTLARTPAMLELFSQTFGVDYPYPRYAQVFAADFIFGGMENTSATTLTDVILIDERAALDYDIDALVAHELAHQWFGDLVTCRDWGEGWLNEGFATYAEYRVARAPRGSRRRRSRARRAAAQLPRRGRRALSPDHRHQALRRADRHLRSSPVREGRAGPAHGAARAGRRRLLRQPAPLPDQAPPRRGRDPRSGARDRGRHRPGPRRVLLASG